MKFREHLAQVISQLAPEHRMPVAEALRASDGTAQSFEQELQAATWEHPELPVQDIMQSMVVDQ
jgi:hypothetical protein